MFLHSSVETPLGRKRRMTITLDVAWKYLRSFFKRRWSAADYPVRVKAFDGDPAAYDGGHLKPIPFHAQIVNWWQMGGSGATPEAALADLDANLENRRRAGQRLPRPGTGLPIQFAPAYRMSEHPDLAIDFFKRILDLDYDDCFISDQSSLWDFHNQEDNTYLYDKIILTYGVDVSDIEGARIADILERLVARGVSA
jgi:hypothetical protein